MFGSKCLENECLGLIINSANVSDQIFTVGVRCPRDKCFTIKS